MAGLTALVAAWHFTFRRLGIDEDRPWLVAAYLAGLFALWFLLAGSHPAFFSLLLVLYPQVFRHLRLARAIPAAVVLSVAVVWREVLASGRPLSENPGAVVGGLLSVVFGTLLALWITRIIEESYERRQLIEQLEATRSELAAAEREGGRLAERQRLARDIHDTLAQGFVSIVLQLQGSALSPAQMRVALTQSNSTQVPRPGVTDPEPIGPRPDLAMALASLGI